MSKTKKELAFLYDLYIAPTWRDCFDRLFNEKIGLPGEGRILDVNCGTGGHAIEMADSVADKGDVIAVDESLEMIGLASAKASIKKLKNLSFSVGSTYSLAFPDNSFDLVVGDATFMPPDRLNHQIKELVRVAKPGARVVINVATRGSFDEFFSIFWEALYECDIADELLGKLEGLIKARPTVSDTESMMNSAGLGTPHSFQKKEQFAFETAEVFFNSPLIDDYLMEGWLAILPAKKVEPVTAALKRIIERERGGYSFDVSIKATVLTAEKRNLPQSHRDH